MQFLAVSRYIPVVHKDIVNHVFFQFMDLSGFELYQQSEVSDQAHEYLKINNKYYYRQ